MKKRLRIGIAWDNVADLPDWSSGPKGSADDVYRFIRQAGYEAVQGGDGELCGRNNLALIGIGIVPEPKDAEHFIRHWKRQGAIAITCIAGFGFEADRDMDTLQSDLWFIPELLGTKYQYTRTFQAADGSLREETDRWQQAAVLSEMGRRLYAQMAAKGTF